MERVTRGPWEAVFLVVAALAAVSLACGGGGGKAAAPAPPAAPQAQPAPAAPAPAAPSAPAPVQKPAATEVEIAKNFIPGAGQTPKYGGVLNSGLRNDPRAGWDPMKTDNYDLTLAGSPITGYGNLVRACRESVYKICPGLAESWQSNTDFTVWTFKIRDNVLWHDGTPLTAEDAKFWLELSFFGAKSGEKSRGPNWYKGFLGDLQKVEVLPGNRVQVTLGKPAPQYLFRMGEPRAAFAHPRHLTQNRIQQGEVDIAPIDIGYVGTGPFKFQSWDRGVRVQVRKFDKYWEKDEQGRQLPYLDGIDLYVMRDATAFDAAFRTGQLDAGPRAFPYYLNPERKPAYVRDLGDKVWYAEIGSPVNHLSLNVLKPGPLQDVRVRKAISLWMDQQEFIKSVQGFGFMGVMLNPKNPMGTPESEFLKWPGVNPATKGQDRAEAKRLLAEAGYAGGVTLTFLYPAPRWANFAEFFLGHLKPLGVNMELKPSDDAGYAGGRLTTDYNTLFGGNYGWVVPEALESDLTRYATSKAAAAKHDDPKVDEYFRRLNSATSYDQRVKVWREFEHYFLQEQWYGAPLGGQTSVVPYRSYVKGVVIPPERVQEYLEFATVWLDK